MDHRDNVDDLLRRADMAMYEAKASGRNTVRFFDRKMQDILMIRATLENDLRAAMTKGEFLLFYQPQTIGKYQLSGVEALVRWLHPQRGLVSPAEFIPC